MVSRSTPKNDIDGSNFSYKHDILTAMRLIRWCDASIKIGFYLLFGLVPLLLTPWNYELFEYNKMIAVYVVTALIATSWIVKSIAQKEFRVARTPLDIPLGLFVASQLVSTLLSIDPHVSWLGYYSRFNGGMWSIISYVILYYALVSNGDLFTKEIKDTVHAANTSSKHKQKSTIAVRFVSTIPALLKAGVVTAVLVAFYGVLERLGIDKHLWVQDVQNRVFSTLGQPNWLAAYIVGLMPIPWALAIKQLSEKETGSRPSFLLSFVISLLFFVVLLFTRSRSGLLGFLVMDVIFWGYLWLSTKQPIRDIKTWPIFKPLAFLHIAFALAIWINGTGSVGIDKFVTFQGWKSALQNVSVRQRSPTETATPSAVVAGPALEVGGTESAVIRKYVWQAAVNAWASSVKTKLIGTGTETFAFAFYQHRPVGHNQTSEWDFLYNKAHNEYLNYLATTGALGLGSYLLFIATCILWFVKVHRPQVSVGKGNDPAINIALFAGWASVLVTNFFGFSVVALQLFLFLFPALILVSEPKYMKTATVPVKIPTWFSWLVTVGGLFLITRICSYWYADTLYASGYRLVRSGNFGAAIPAFTGAIRINGNEPAYHDELGSAYATLAVAAFEGSNATQAAQLATLAVGESIAAINTSPNNVNLYKTRTKIYYTLSSLEPTFNAKAVETLEYAVKLSPNDPKIYYNLAILLGREGDSNKAIEYLEKAKALKSNYRDAYYALWVFYTEEKKPSEARAILQEYLTKVDPNDQDFQERIK